MNKLKTLGVWMLILITIGAVDNIRNLPTTALFGSKIIAFYILASLFFLIPCAFVSAEFSAKYPNESGIYSWVKNTFNARWGFVAIWLQWVENIPFYPAILSFIAATVGYLVSPELATNKYYLLTFVLISFWCLTLINIYGIRLSAWFSSVCTVAGLIVPMTLILSMGVIWVLSGKPAAIHITLSNAIPHFTHLSVWVTMQGVLLGLCGIELATVHAKDTRNPRKTFPIALFVSVVVIILTLTLGSLSIAMIIPTQKLSLVSGIMETFHVFLATFHIHWLLPILGVMLAIGSLGGVNSWIIAPTRGLRVACTESNMPRWFIRKNSHSAPASLLLFQAILVSFIIIVFFLIPSVNGAYWLLSVLAAQIYMMMYMLMFFSSIINRLKNKPAGNHYQIPGGLIGHLVVAGLGLVGSTLAFLICFIPPSNIQIGNLNQYELLLVGSLFLLAFMPLAIKKNKKNNP